MSHVPPRRGNRKGYFAQWAEQVEQGERMKKNAGKDELPGDIVEQDIQRALKDAFDRHVRQMWSLPVSFGSLGHSPVSIHFDFDCPLELPPAPPALPRRKSTEGFVGFRGWRLCEDARGFGLASTAHDFLWDGPVLRDEQPPAERERTGAHTGIHAYADVMAAWNHVVNCFVPPHLIAIPWYGERKPRFKTVPGAAIMGEVLLFGTVVVHEAGYRAQCAMIRSLYVPPPVYFQHPDIVPQLAARYQCDVHTDPAQWRPHGTRG